MDGFSTIRRIRVESRLQCSETFNAAHSLISLLDSSPPVMLAIVGMKTCILNLKRSVKDLKGYENSIESALAVLGGVRVSEAEQMEKSIYHCLCDVASTIYGVRDDVRELTLDIERNPKGKARCFCFSAPPIHSNKIGLIDSYTAKIKNCVHDLRVKYNDFKTLSASLKVQTDADAGDDTTRQMATHGIVFGSVREKRYNHNNNNNNNSFKGGRNDPNYMVGNNNNNNFNRLVNMVSARTSVDKQTVNLGGKDNSNSKEDDEEEVDHFASANNNSKSKNTNSRGGIDAKDVDLVIGGQEEEDDVYPPPKHVSGSTNALGFFERPVPHNLSLKAQKQQKEHRQSKIFAAQPSVPSKPEPLVINVSEEKVEDDEKHYSNNNMESKQEDNTIEDNNNNNNNNNLDIPQNDLQRIRQSKLQEVLEQSWNDEKNVEMSFSEKLQRPAEVSRDPTMYSWLSDEEEFNQSDPETAEDEGLDDNFVGVPSRNKQFVGRDRMLRAIDRKLSQQGKVVVVGQSGSGKTQVVLEYAHRYSRYYSMIWWMEAASDAQLLNAYLEMAHDLGLVTEQQAYSADDVIKKVQLWLQSNPGWLLIFNDSASEEQLQPFIADGGCVLCCSCNSSMWSTISKIDSHGLREEEAKQLLLQLQGIRTLESEKRRKRLKIRMMRKMGLGGPSEEEMKKQEEEEEKNNNSNLSPTEEYAISDIIHILNRFPISIQMAGLYLKQGAMSHSEYLKLCNESIKELEENHNNNNNNNNNSNNNFNDAETVETVMDIPMSTITDNTPVKRSGLHATWNSLSHILSKLNPWVEDIARVCCILGDKNIPRWLLDRWVRRNCDSRQRPILKTTSMEKLNINELWSKDNNSNSKGGHRDIPDDVVCDIVIVALRELMGLGLIGWDRYIDIGVRPSYAHVTPGGPLTPGGPRRQMANETVTSSEYDYSISMHPLIQQVIRQSIDPLTLQTYIHGCMLLMQEILIQPLVDRVAVTAEVKARKLATGDESAVKGGDVIDQTDDHSNNNSNSSKKNKKAVGAKKGKRGHKRTPSAKKFVRVKSKIDTGLHSQPKSHATHGQGHKRKSSNEHLHVTVTNEEVTEAIAGNPLEFVTSNSDASTLGLLSSSFRLTVHHSQVLLNNMHVVAEDGLLTTHPIEMADLYSVVGMYFSNIGIRSRLSIGCFRRAVNTAKEVLGIEHPRVITYLLKLGDALVGCANEECMEDAVHNIHEALTIAQKLHGKEHFTVATCLAHMARAMNIAGQFDRAVSFGSKAMDIDKKTFGSVSPSLSRDYFLLGEGYKGLAQFREAVKYFDLATKMDEKCLGEEHNNVIRDLEMAASVLRSMSKFKASITKLQRALELTEQLHGEKNPKCARILNAIGTCLESQGRVDDAITYYTKALSSIRATYGDDHPDTALCLSNLGMAYDSLGCYEEAIGFYEKAVEIDTKAFGEDHPNVATSLNNLGFALNANGHHSEAIDLYLKALEIKKKVFGPNHEDVAATLNNLGSAYYMLKEPLKAEGYLQQAYEICNDILGMDHPDTKLYYENWQGVFKEDDDKGRTDGNITEPFADAF